MRDDGRHIRLRSNDSDPLNGLACSIFSIEDTQKAWRESLCQRWPWFFRTLIRQWLYRSDHFGMAHIRLKPREQLFSKIYAWKSTAFTYGTPIYDHDISIKIRMPGLLPTEMATGSLAKEKTRLYYNQPVESSRLMPVASPSFLDTRDLVIDQPAELILERLNRYIHIVDRKYHPS